jgi:hypothetical protein
MMLIEEKYIFDSSHIMIYQILSDQLVLKWFLTTISTQIGRAKLLLKG